MARIKPRWEKWETICIQKAYEEKIQLKIIATALGRTLTSISKKIKMLGLRAPTSIRGRIKGRKNFMQESEKTPIDIAKMKSILKTYAPLKISQDAKGALKDPCWTLAKPFSNYKLKIGKCVGYMEKEVEHFSFSTPLDYIISKDHLPKRTRKEKLFGDPYYVPLNYMEKWATIEGFHQIKENLRDHGVLYWRDGKYFSKAQLLIYVNRIRHEKKLQPLALWEEEVF